MLPCVIIQYNQQHTGLNHSVLKIPLTYNTYYIQAVYITFQNTIQAPIWCTVRLKSLYFYGTKNNFNATKNNISGTKINFSATKNNFSETKNSFCYFSGTKNTDF